MTNPPFPQQPAPAAPKQGPSVLLVATVLLAVGVLVAGGVTVWALLTRPAAAVAAWPDGATSVAVNTAKDCVRRLESVSYQTVDQDLKGFSDGCLTPQAREAFAAPAKKLRKDILAAKAVSEARVGQTGVVESGTGRVVVLVVVDVSGRTAENPAGGTRAYRVRLDMTNMDGRWLIAQQKFL